MGVTLHDKRLELGKKASLLRGSSLGFGLWQGSETTGGGGTQGEGDLAQSLAAFPFPSPLLPFPTTCQPGLSDLAAGERGRGTRGNGLRPLTALGSGSDSSPSMPSILSWQAGPGVLTG